MPPIDLDKAPAELTAEYDATLRREASGYRAAGVEEAKRRATAETALEALKAAAEAERTKAAADAEALKAARITAEKSALDATTAANTRVMAVELKSAAVRAGLIDADDLRLVDVASLKINAKGEVEGLDALVEGLKTAKPHLFGAAGALPVVPGVTSNPAKPPNPNLPAAKHVKDMTDAEYAAARKEIGKVPLRLV